MIRRTSSSVEQRRSKGNAALFRPTPQPSLNLNQLRAAMRHVTIGVVISDGQGNLLDWNPAALRMHGFSTLQEVQAHLSEFAELFEISEPGQPPLSLDQWPLARLMRGEPVDNLELSTHRKDTSQRWMINYIGTVIQDEGGDGSLIILNMEDRTEMRRSERLSRVAESALRESDIRLRAVVESAIVAIVTLDQRGIVESVNPAVTRIFGYQPSEVLGQHIHLLVAPRPGHKRADSDTNAIGIARESTGMAKDKRQIPLDISINEMFIGGRRKFTAIIRDMTAQKQAELQLQDKQTLVRTLVEGITDPVYIRDAAGYYRFVNSALARLAGRTVEECIGEKITSLFSPEVAKSAIDADLIAMESDNPTNYEASVHVAGELRHYLVTKLRYLDSTGAVAGVFGISRDITSRKLAEHRDREQQAELAHLERVQTMGHLAAGLAHELNQPLSAIANYASASHRLITAGKSNPDQLKQVLQDVEAEALRAGEIIRRLRAFVQKQSSHKVPVQLSSLIAESLRILNFELRESSITVHQQLVEQNSPVHADPIQITQVLVNLIRNAVQAIRPQAADSRQISIQTRVDTKNITVSITDSGPQIDAGEVEKMFKAFHSTKSTGMGIGLSLCRMIIENHHGQIFARANPTGGMQFSFSLPIQTERGS